LEAVKAIARPDIEAVKKRLGETRSMERLAAHFELELELAEKLRSAPRQDRSRIYGEVYGQLFAALPDHPQKTRRPGAVADRVSAQVGQLGPFIGAETDFLEIGCGDAALSVALSGRVRRVFALDVTAALLPAEPPPNLTFVRTKGVDVALPDASIDFAYSNQLVEHLHPEDAVDQFREIRRVLRPGGKYFCTTPSRFTGPHDVSCYFGYEPLGFHLKEYDYGSLSEVFLSSGFARVKILVTVKGARMSVPYGAARSMEAMLLAFPRSIRARLIGNPIASSLFGITMIGQA
jgi:SAM-dependent methyltransferase